jgi:hypothetical protein
MLLLLSVGLAIPSLALLLMGCSRVALIMIIALACRYTYTLLHSHLWSWLFGFLILRCSLARNCRARALLTLLTVSPRALLVALVKFSFRLSFLLFPLPPLSPCTLVP